MAWAMSHVADRHSSRLAPRGRGTAVHTAQYPLSKMMKLSLLFFVWYSTATVCNLTSKVAVSSFASTSLLSFCQFLISAMLGYVCLLARGAQVVPLIPAPELLLPLGRVSFVFTLGFFTVNKTLEKMPVSLSETLRAVEPIFSALLAHFYFKTDVISLKRFLVMIIIVSGAALSSFASVEMSIFGLLLSVSFFLLFLSEISICDPIICRGLTRIFCCRLSVT